MINVECVHIVEDREACNIDDDGDIEFFHVWICERCGKETSPKKVVEFLEAGSRTRH